MAARDGVTFVEITEEERGILSPSRFSTGGSSLATLDCLSSHRSKLNDKLLLGVFSPSDSPSLESLSYRPG
jgi:hypothetical protein